MSQNFKPELVGVFGHPVAENPTVVMIEAAFQELGLFWRYLTIEVLPHDLEKAFLGLRAFNMRGCNLTIPHKVEALKYLDKVAEDAKLMGAVNCVRREGDRLIGENTDGKGFMRSLREDAGIDPNGKNVVVLGAGGASRAMTVELALAGVNKLTLVNRSEERGSALAKHLQANTSAQVEFVHWTGDYAIPEGTNVVANATSIGLFPNVDDRPALVYDSIQSNMTVCDVIPNPPRTPFLKEAEKRGAQTLDGLGMLVYQGAIGFKMWTGQEAPIEPMRKALENL